MNPPPLPDSWPFVPRSAPLEPNRFEGCQLPGMSGEWQLYCTNDLAGLNNAVVPDGLFGRGGLILAGNYVFRPYRRGGMVRHFNKGTYLSSARFRAEYEVHSTLWLAGFPTVEPVGYAFRRHLWGVQGVFITKKANGLPWPCVWTDLNAECATRVADLISSLAVWGLWAPDLNATNFIVLPDGRILALDWDRAVWTSKSPPLLIEDYRKRLKRSLHKLNAPASMVEELEDLLQTKSQFQEVP